MATKNLMIRCVADFSGLTKATESAKKGVASLKQSADSAGTAVKNCGNKATKGVFRPEKSSGFYRDCCCGQAHGVCTEGIDDRSDWRGFSGEQLEPHDEHGEIRIFGMGKNRSSGVWNIGIGSNKIRKHLQ